MGILKKDSILFNSELWKSRVVVSVLVLVIIQTKISPNFTRTHTHTHTHTHTPDPKSFLPYQLVAGSRASSFWMARYSSLTCSEWRHPRIANGWNPLPKKCWENKCLFQQHENLWFHCFGEQVFRSKNRKQTTPLNMGFWIQQQQNTKKKGSVATNSQQVRCKSLETFFGGRKGGGCTICLDPRVC